MKPHPETVCLRRNPLVLVAAALATLLASVLTVHGASAGGTITGQVSNAATRAYLEGAIVEVKGTNQIAVTDREGRFEIAGLTADAVTLAVSYTGLDAQEIPVSVKPGQRVVRDVELTSGVYRLDTYTVAGDREGTAKAETLQRLAPNVKSILASDTFGNFADGNVGELLQHVVGITATYNGPEVQKVSIRGIDSALNSVTMNGMQMATSQSANTGRQFEFEQASLANIERIEVTKAPTPDMPGSSLSGNVNLITKSAFDSSAGRSISYTLGMTTQPGYSGQAERWKQPIKGFGPSMNFTYSDVYGEKRNLGITITGLFHSAPIGGAYIQGAYESKPDPGPVYTFSLIRSDVHGATNSRIAFGADIDYKWTDHTTLSLSTYYGFYHQNNDTRNHSIATARPTTGFAILDASGNRTGGGFVNSNYADGITRIYPGPSSVSTVTAGTNDKSGHTEVFAPRVRQKFENGLSINYLTSYSRSATYYDVNHDRDKYDSRPKGTVTARLANIGFNIDRSKDLIWPNVVQTAGPNMWDLSNYSGLTLSQFDKRGYDIVLGANVDARKDFRQGILTYAKAGLSWQQQRRIVWNQTRTFTYTGPDGVLGNADDAAGMLQFLDPRSATDDEIKYYKPNGGIAPWPDSYGIARHQKDNPDLWKENAQTSLQTRLQSDQKIEEIVQAAYVMGNLHVGKVDVLSGVRLETTDPKGEGALNYISPDEAARRAAWVGTVTDQEGRRRALAQFGTRITNTGHYQELLPSVHAKYQPIPGVVARLSWSTGVGRPPFGSIIPNTSPDDTNMRVTASNPDLKPQFSNNYDADVSYFFKPQGMLSIGAFRKDIKDYIYTDTTGIVGAGTDNGFDGQYVGYKLTTSRNAGEAWVRGVEFSYQQQLTFLPSWARGFGLFANYTTMSSGGLFSGTPTGNTSSGIPNFLNKFGNAGVSYRGHGFDLRLMANYRGRYLTAFNAVPGLAEYQKPRTLWSWKSRYTINRYVGVFVDLENLFEAWLDDRYVGYEDRVNFQRTYHTKITFGINGKF